MSVAEHAAHAGDGHHEASYGETPESIERRQRLAVLLFIGADVVFVLMLIFTYFYLRGLNVNDAWLPAGVQTVSQAMSWVIAAVAVASAAVYAWAASGDESNQGRLRAGTVIAMLLLLVDLVLQVIQLADVPFHSTSGAYASGFLVLAGYHVVHLLVAMVIGLGAYSRVSRGLYGPGHRSQVHLISYVWIWIAVSAVLFATTLLFTTSAHATTVTF